MLKNKYLAIFLSVIAIIVVYLSFVKGFIMRKQPRSLPEKQIAKVEEKYEAPVVESIDLNNPLKIEEISYNPSEEWKRDIFRKIFFNEETGKTQMEELPELTAIVRDNKRVFAILNGKIVKEGERINGILVKKILTNSVIIDRGAGAEYVYVFNLQKGGEVEKTR